MLIYLYVTAAIMVTIILVAINSKGSVDDFLVHFNKGLEKAHQCTVSKNEFIILCVVSVVLGFIIIPTLTISSVWSMIE